MRVHETGEHPFQAAWRTRALDPWMEMLAPDVVLRSPVLRAPFTGHAAVRELYGVLFEVFGRMEVTSELRDGDSHAFRWRGELAGHQIDGIDLLRYDAEGRIAEIAVMIRPLVDIGVFAAAVGPALAAKRSPFRGLLVSVLVWPLKAMLAVADLVSTRLLGLG